MKLSVLDIFLLSMLDRGVQSPYELQREAGVSLGASLPSLRRLIAQKLVTRTEGKAVTNRPRHQYRLTSPGKQAARAGWKLLLEDGDAPPDLDSTLRLVDMAAHYGADQRKIRAFLKRAAEGKSLLAKQAALSSKAVAKSEKVSYAGMRFRCDASRHQAEAEILLRISESFIRKGEHPGQQSLL